MNRRAVVRLLGTLGATSLAVRTSSQRAGSSASGSATDHSPIDEPATDEAATDNSSTIQRGRRIVDQPADSSATPSEPPAVEAISEAIDAETAETVRSIRLATERLFEQLRESDLAVDDLSVSKRLESDQLKLFVEHSDEIDTDSWRSAIEAAREEIPAAVDERLLDRLDELDIEINHRTRPVARPEYGCESTVGRFADAQYRERGIAMGAAVRSETLGEIASSGFRGLREGHAVVVTTAHTFETDDSHEPSELRGAELYQSRRPHVIGRCHAMGRDHGPGVDAAAVAVDAESYPSRLLAEPGGDSYHDEPIVGTASWELLETHLAEDRPIYKQGAVTGRCEGRIVELREYSGGYREVDVDIHSGGGDSGGPYFVETDDGLLVAAIHKGVRTDSGERRAIFVDSVCESLDIELY